MNAWLFVDGRSIISLSAGGSNGNFQKWRRPCSLYLFILQHQVPAETLSKHSQKGK